jgi:2'-5' RNA ligase
VRLFLAIDLPDDVRRHVWDAVAPLRETAPDIAWVREPLLHLTLKFFGEQPDDTVERLRPVLARIAAQHARPVVRFTDIGAFPNLRRPNVVWVGVEPDPRLELLHHDVEVELEPLGFELDGRPFRPHLTIARVRNRMDQRSVRALAKVARKVHIDAEFIVSSIDLMQSTLGNSGSTYATLVGAPLRGS